MSRSKGPPKSTGATPQSWSCTCSRSQSAVVARASSRASWSSQESCTLLQLNLLPWRPKGTGSVFPTQIQVPSAHTNSPPTRPHPRLPPGPAQLCVHPLRVTKAPWSLGVLGQSVSLEPRQSRRIETNHLLPRPHLQTTHPIQRPAHPAIRPFDPSVGSKSSPSRHLSLHHLSPA